MIGRRVDRVDHDLRAHLAARRVEKLCVDGVGICRLPHGNEPAAGQPDDIDAVLVAHDRGVDGNLAAELAAIVGEALRHHPIAIGIAAGISPNGHEPAATEGGKLRLELRARHEGVEGEFTAQRRAVGRIALAQHVVAVTGGGVGVVAAIRDDEGSVGQPQHRRFVLAAEEGGIDSKLGAGRRSIGVVALRIDTDTAAVAEVGTPRDDVATVDQPRNARFILSAQRLRVDLELRPCRRAVGVVALGKYAVRVAVLCVLGHPGDHVAAIVGPEQSAHRRIGLLASFVGVGLLFGEQRHRRAGASFLRVVDDHIAVGALHVGAVVQLHADRSAFVRARGGAAIAQVLDHTLDGLIGGAGVEGDLQAAAVAAIQRGADAADGNALVVDGASGDTHLPGGRALVADRQLIVDASGRAHIRHQQLASVEAAGSGVVDLHGVIDDDT